MNRNRLFILSLMSLAVGMLFVTSCGGGGSGGVSTTPAPIMLASVDSAGAEANNASYAPAISSDGRYVAFVSDATNLVANDGNIKADVFVHDTTTGIISRVSVSTAGTEGNFAGMSPAISSNGRYVVFDSWANNLVANDINSFSDVFVRDTTTGAEITSRVSVSTAGTEGNGISSFPAISSNGRYVAFDSWANNLVANDINNSSDVFVRDTTTGAEITSRVSVSSAGTEGNGESRDPAISSDGRYVAYQSFADNLVANDTNNADDIFVYDTITSITSRVSVSTAGTEGNNNSESPSISSDGRYVTFHSFADNLVANDTNGVFDVFVRDTVDNITSRVSVSATGTEANGGSQNPVISSDGRYIAFESPSTNLIAGTTLSGVSHIFRAPRP